MLYPVLAFFFAVIAILLMVLILLQRGKGVGLSGAFGGSGGGHAAFGSKAGDVLTWMTIILAGLFLLYSVLLNYVFVPTGPGLGGGTSGGTTPDSGSGSSWHLEQPADSPDFARAGVFGETQA